MAATKTNTGLVLNGNDFERDYTDFNINFYKRKGKWTIVNALDCVLELSRLSKFSEGFWEKAKSPLRFLKKELELTDMQCIILACMIESGTPESWRSLGTYFGLSRLTMMTYSEEIEALIPKGWLCRSTTYEEGRTYQAFGLVSGVVTALRKNKVFIPEKLDGLSLQEFIERLDLFFEGKDDPMSTQKQEVLEWLDIIIEKNLRLDLCKVLADITDPNEKLFFLMVLLDYCDYADSEGEGLYINNLSQRLPAHFFQKRFMQSVQNGELSVFKNHFVEFECIDGIINNERYLLTDLMKEKVLEGFVPSRNACQESQKRMDNYLIKQESIKAKDMYYNPNEETEIDRLTSLLDINKFEEVQTRLKEEGMRTGFACIFYGEPGTGKTETVLQLAKKTGRDIMQIDIARMRDKWVGETEKNIKKVFDRYRKMCHLMKTKPILFFNEADAIFGKRMETAESSVDKMNNAMQNIILQEMENLDGILIATTNLTGSLDPAFERRFLFKIEFKNPTNEVRSKIWKSMLGVYISEKDAMELAKKYNFSGGEIENIARKRSIDYIIEGVNPSIEKLKGYCENELLKKKNRVKVGF